MATAEAIMDLPLHCSICFEKYIAPKSLPCGHTFCQSCIEKIPLEKMGYKTTFPCPKCRGTVEVPTSESTCEFPTNYAMLDVIDSLQSTNLCPKHEEPQNLFCDTCDECICAECLVETHKAGVSPGAHDVISSKIPRDKTLKRLQSLAEELKNSQHKKLLDRISLLEKQQAQNFVHIRKEINKQKEQLIREIETQAEDLIKAAEIDAKEKQENIDDVKNKIEREHAEQTRRAEVCSSLAREISKNGLSQVRYEGSNSLFSSEREAIITETKSLTSSLDQINKVSNFTEFFKNHENDYIVIGKLAHKPASNRSEPKARLALKTNVKRKIIRNLINIK